MKRHYWIIATYIFLAAIAIPWYWPNNINYTVIGLPHWVVISVIVSIITSFFTAFILLRYTWDKEKDVDE
tara:strand:- start:294 stop:503 length:210 start_codon:yes stop_codon:yes gene_type:complete